MIRSTLTWKQEAMIEKILSISLFVLFFEGCSNIPKKTPSCKKKNWAQIGKTSGLNGKISTWPPKSIKNCFSGNIQEKAWKKEYDLGYKSGLSTFCTSRYGLKAGLRGIKYRNNCPSKKERSFLKEYKKGLKVFHYKKAINKIQKRILILKKAMKKSGLPRKIQQKKFSKMENLYLQKREISQFLKEFLAAKNIKSVKL